MNDQMTVLLMTATISPKAGVPNLMRTDPTLRLQDYRHALDFYMRFLDKGIDKILFVENSGTDVSSLRQEVLRQKRGECVEFISYDGLDYPPSYDRGYGEFKLIDYGMKHSTILNAARRDQKKIIVWKVTGRYRIENFAALIASRPPDADLYCNYRNYPKKLIDTYLMAWTWKGYQACVEGMYEHLKVNVPGVAEGLVPEELYRTVMDRLPFHDNPGLKITKRFKLTPLIAGYRAGDNKKYSTDGRWKFYVRSAIQTLVPWVWI